MDEYTLVDDGHNPPKFIKRNKPERKLNKKELMIVKAYKEFFPNLQKACDISNTKLIDVLEMMEKNHKFKLEMEAVKVGIFSIAEKVLIEILENEDSSAHHKISTAKVILQYKEALSKF